MLNNHLWCIMDNNIKNRYNVIAHIAKGSYGYVNSALDKQTYTTVAIKEINKNILQDMDTRVKEEIKIMSYISHPNICKFIDWHEDENNYYIIMELIDGKDLFYILESTILSVYDAKKYFIDICHAVKYLHENKIVHRDIKIENILITTDRAVVCDMGFSEFQLDGELLTKRCGSLHMVPPELLNNKNNKFDGYPCDIWALGIVLYIMLSGKRPFNNTNIQYLTDEFIRYKIYSAKMPYEAKHFISYILKVDPKERPTIKQILEHKWISDL